MKLNYKLLLTVFVWFFTGCTDNSDALPLYTDTVDTAQIVSTSANTDESIPTPDYTLTFVPYTPPTLELPFTLADITGMQGVVTSRASKHTQIFGRNSIYYTVHTNENGTAGKYHVFTDIGTLEIFLALSGNAELYDTDGDRDYEIMVYTISEKQLNGRTYMASAHVIDKNENGYFRADLHAAISEYLRNIHSTEAGFSLYCQSVNKFDYLIVTDGTKEDYREYSCLVEYSGEGYKVTDTRVSRMDVHPEFISNNSDWHVETEVSTYQNEAGVKNPLYVITVFGPNGERYSFDNREYGFSSYGEVHLTRSLTVHPNLSYAALCVPDRLYSSDEIPHSSVYIIDLENGKIVYTLPGGELLWKWRETGEISEDPTDYCDKFLMSSVYMTTHVISDENGFGVCFSLIDVSQLCIKEETRIISFT